MTESKRKTILVLAASYLPGYKAGGPVRSIANLVEALGEDCEFRIITSDRDLGEPQSYSGIEPNRWIPLGKGSVMYVPKGFRSLWKFIRTLRSMRADILYLNSFFARRYSMLPAVLARIGVCRPSTLILAPRGE